MLEGVDEVPWVRLGYGFGGPDSVPGLLREIAAAPPGTQVLSPVWRLRHGLFSGYAPSEVFGAAPYLVPYLLEVTGIARQPHRELVVDLMADIADAQPYRDSFRDPAAGPEPDHAALARAAMVGRVDALVQLLDDVSPNVVVAAARLLACLPEAAPRSLPALRARADKARTDQRVRPAGDTGAVACVLAVAWLAAADHTHWFAGLLDTTAAQRDLRAAAAAGLVLADPAAEPGGDAMIRLMAGAQADSGSALQRIRWHGDGVTPIGSALLRAEHWQRAVARDLLARPGQQDIDQALHSAREAIWYWRAAPAELLPMVADRVRDLVSAAPSSRRRRRLGQQDPLVSAVELIADSGQGAAAHADLLAAMLTGDPAEPWPEVAAPAVEGLARLGDGRCVPWLAAALLDEYGHVKHLNIGDMIPAMVAHADALMPALRTFLGPSQRYGDTRSVGCMDALVSWGAAAAPLVPAIAARLPGVYLSVALPLFGAIGPAAADVETRVRALLDDDHHGHEAAWALWRITGEPGQAPALLAEHLAHHGGHAACEVAPMLEQLGPAAEIAVPVLREHFHDAEHGHLYDRVAIARALWAITGETAGLVTPLLNAIAARPLPGRGHRRPASELLAVQALGMMGPATAAAVAALEAIAHGRARVTDRGVWADELYRHVAQHALRA
ncbi:hypothetical protein [Streptosporangium roseum]|uniref:PBS lyase HEAT domain protein repeat-containing protein n=1 Tax=Streptosporangium roseum (strain ATCC 12428 / DSM 43021 / JCM 3005 / KCTC 9067 / NCIMB 10171 / NRRL 2505 / NI 9100) TaxID=479432 RepID=D2AQV4_STRRD|nr:hypothetical protein [Streptosporangium roseum]ACZ86501.1 hypothetical protein Sros_3567 [Streptosporangium roseum DSM 43021]